MMWAPHFIGNKMSLKSITETRMNISGFGVKVFWSCHGRPFPEIYYDINKPLFIQRWLHEKDFRTNANSKKSTIDVLLSKLEYPMGWHIFTNVQDAEDWINLRRIDLEYYILAVDYRGGHTKGYMIPGNYIEVVVASEIKIGPNQLNSSYLRRYDKWKMDDRVKMYQKELLEKDIITIK